MNENVEREKLLAAMEQLKTHGETAYNAMYDTHSSGEARAQFDLAYDSLTEAAKIAGELGIVDAAALRERAAHVRKVYRHQFMQPPDLKA